MYLVTVTRLDTGETIDSRSFSFGTWTEIGLWLDHYGYNDDRFEVKIQFGEL